MMNLDTLTHNGKTINIVADHDSESPRNWDNLGTMICFHRRYTLGDTDNWSVEQMNEIQCNDKKYIALPLYLYDHSGLTISTSPFSCPWDSGQVGVIFVERSKVREEYDWAVITKKRKEQIIKSLIGEVETYDKYLRGDVCGFEILNSDGQVEDSCYGFYSQEDAIAEAKACA